MKKPIAVILSLGVILSLTACKDSDGQMQNSGGQSAASSQTSTQEENKIVIHDEEPQSQSSEQTSGEQQEEGQGNKYAHLSAEEDFETAHSYLTLNPDGTFIIEIRAYDGMPTITGTYTFEADIYNLTAIETNAYDIDIEKLETIQFLKNGDNLTYQGDGFGEVSSGSEFVTYG